MSIRLHTLDNGFRVVTESMPGLQSAALGIWVSAGTRNERTEENGIAHFLEHMAFKGTKNRSALEIAETIENVGGYINAYTSREVTAYYVRVLENDVALGFDLISDIILNSVFDQREIEIERGVILQEIGQTNDTPDDVIFDWLHELSYPDQAFGRSILGTTERVSAFSRSDLQSFVGNFYGPERLILSAAGSVDHDQLLRLAEEKFGHLTPKALPVLPKAHFVQNDKRVERSLEQAHFALNFETPGYSSDLFPVAQLLAIILGGGMSSRLFQVVREQHGLCYSIFAQQAGYVDTGNMTIYAGTSGDDIHKLGLLVADVLRASVTDMSQIELDRARMQYKAGLLMGLESSSNRCERLARQLAIWGRVLPVEEIVERFEAISVQNIRDYAETLYQGKMTQVLYGPVSKANELDVLTRRLAA